MKGSYLFCQGEVLRRQKILCSIPFGEANLTSQPIRASDASDPPIFTCCSLAPCRYFNAYKDKDRRRDEMPHLAIRHLSSLMFPSRYFLEGRASSRARMSSSLPVASVSLSFPVLWGFHMKAFAVLCEIACSQYHMLCSNPAGLWWCF